MNFTFYSAHTFEPWDWSTPLGVGIGGSETSHVEMAQRLARRGNSVASFAPIGGKVDAEFMDPAGVTWCDSKTWPEYWPVNYKTIAVIYRDPAALDKIPDGVPAWLICQDVHYDNLTEERAAKLTRIVALCDEHALHLKAYYPFAADKVCVSSNGIRSELIRERIAAQMAGEIERNPKRLMYASSPDRGLWFALHIFSRVRELVPDAEFHVFYGFNNVDKVAPRIRKARPYAAELLDTRNQAIRDALEAPGVVHHGRIGQREIVDEWLKTGIWLHPSDFSETSCITCMDAQACGAIPVTTPKWAIRENVQFGTFIEGNPETSGLTRARYVAELVGLLNDPVRQIEIRSQMQGWALSTFDWENFVSQWEHWAAEDLDKREQTRCLPAELRPTARGWADITCKQAIGTMAYMGGIQSTLEPFTWAWGDLVEFTTEALCGENQYINRDRARYSLHDKARNELCERIAGDWLFMLDCDLVFEPDVCAHLVSLMYKYDLDVVTGMYPYKNNPTFPIADVWNEKDRRYEHLIWWDESADLIEIGAGGAGMLLIRKRVLDQIELRLKQKPFDRVNSNHGEDFAFFERCRALGIKIHCAWRTQAGHLDFQSKMLDMKNLNRERFANLERETGGISVGEQKKAQKGA